jgi:hypothetical protein
MENTVIKVLTKEHGAKVIKWWESQGIDTGSYNGTICESEGFNCIYYGIINGDFENYNRKDVDHYNAKIIELPEDEFDMTTNEGRLAYAKKHYPVGTVIKSIHHDKVYKLISEPRNYMKTTIIADSHGVVADIYHCGEWAEIIKEEKVMETQKLTRAGLKEIHSVACSNWKAVLEKYGANSPLEDYIELTQEEVDEMFTACTKDQLPIVSKYLKQDDGSVDVTKFEVSGKGFCNDNFYIIRDREWGEYKKQSFLLSEKYNWEIKTDALGQLCLIPTKKKRYGK